MTVLGILMGSAGLFILLGTTAFFITLRNRNRHHPSPQASVEDLSESKKLSLHATTVPRTSHDGGECSTGASPGQPDILKPNKQLVTTRRRNSFSAIDASTPVSRVIFCLD